MTVMAYVPLSDRAESVTLPPAPETASRVAPVAPLTTDTLAPVTIAPA